jgi:hypothetical protein
MARGQQTCGIRGGIGHNRMTCPRKEKAGKRADGATVRELAPGVTGQDLNTLRMPKKLARATPREAASTGGTMSTAQVRIPFVITIVADLSAGE